MISDELKNVKISKNSLIFEGLKVGYYILHLKDINQKIDIEVLDGKYWNEQKQTIQTENALYDIKGQMNIIFMENVEQKVKEDNDEAMQLKLKIFSTHPEITRVHVFAFNYMPQDVNWYCDSLEAINKEVDSKVIPVIKSK